MRKALIRWAIVLGVVALVFFVASPGNVLMLDYYELEDADTIRVGTSAGSAAWTRVTDVTETSSKVQITVKSWSWPVPQADVGYPIELTVNLETPLGDRQVTDLLHVVPLRTGDAGTVSAD